MNTATAVRPEIAATYQHLDRHALKVQGLNANQRKVYHTLRDQGPLTDFELGYAYRLQHGELDQSWSGLRTRRRELEDRGLVVEVAKKRNNNGRLVSVFAVA